MARSRAVFENPEIAPEDLPEAASVDWQPLDPAYRSMRLLVGAITSLIIAFGVSMLYFILSRAFAADGVPVPLWWMWLLPPIIAALLLTWPFLAVPRMGYSVRDKDLLYRTGVFVHAITAIPYNRLQHVEKDSTPLDRYFGIANLKLFTAGGAGGDLRIQGLSDDVAERLRAHLLDKIGSAVER